MERRPRRQGEGSTLSSPASRRRGGPAGLAPVATPVGGTGGKTTRGGVGPVSPVGLLRSFGPRGSFPFFLFLFPFLLFIFIFLFCFILDTHCF